MDVSPWVDFIARRRNTGHEEWAPLEEGQIVVIRNGVAQQIA